ncbi:WXG100-like domain-containing protein [Mycobacterium sp. Dal123C01]|uniref:WXG100-like domain-containing protein n=1 Tax=Mycobacterium sp. Dal123C01 TaxID=3457577 RepID=UPI00403E8B74
MTIPFPPDLQWVAYLAGSAWPKGDETAMFNMGDDWNAAAQQLEALIPSLKQVSSKILSALSGATGDAVAAQFQMLLSGDNSIQSLVTAMSTLGSLCRNTGTQIEYTKLQILSTLAIAAVEIAYLLAMADWTLGLSLLQIPMVEGITMAAIRTMVSQLMRRIVTAVAEAMTKTAVKMFIKDQVPKLLAAGVREAVQETVISEVQEFAIEGYQWAAGHRDGFDFKQLVDAGGGAALGGFTASLLHGPLTHALGESTTIAGKVVNGAITHYGLGFVGNVVGSAATGGLDTVSLFLGPATGGIHGALHGVAHGGIHGGTGEPHVGTVKPVDPGVDGDSGTPNVDWAKMVKPDLGSDGDSDTQTLVGDDGKGFTDDPHEEGWGSDTATLNGDPRGNQNIRGSDEGTSSGSHPPSSPMSSSGEGTSTGSQKTGALGLESDLANSPEGAGSNGSPTQGATGSSISGLGPTSGSTAAPTINNASGSHGDAESTAPAVQQRPNSVAPAHGVSQAGSPNSSLLNPPGTGARATATGQPNETLNSTPPARTSLAGSPSASKIDATAGTPAARSAPTAVLKAGDAPKSNDLRHPAPGALQPVRLQPSPGLETNGGDRSSETEGAVPGLSGDDIGQAVPKTVDQQDLSQGSSLPGVEARHYNDGDGRQSERVSAFEDEELSSRRRRDVAGDESWRHSSVSSATWFDPRDPVLVEAWWSRRDGAHVATVDTEIADVLSHSTPAKPVSIVGLVRYDLRRIEVAPGRFVQDYTVKIHLGPAGRGDGGVVATTVGELKDRAIVGVEKMLNQGYRLPTGDQFHVSVEFTDNAADAHTVIKVVGEGDTDQTHWRADASGAVLAHEILHYLGVPDEHRDPERVLLRSDRNAGVHRHDGGVMGAGVWGHDPRVMPRHLWLVERTARSQVAVTDTLVQGTGGTHHVRQSSDDTAARPMNATRPAPKHPRGGASGSGDRRRRPVAGASRSQHSPPDSQAAAADVEMVDVNDHQESSSERPELTVGPQELRVPPDGWCLLYSVVASTPPHWWPARLYQGWANSAHDAHQQVIDQLHDFQRGPGRVAPTSPLRRAARALHAMVVDWVTTHGHEAVPAEAIQPFRSTESQEQARFHRVFGENVPTLRAQLHALGVNEVRSGDWLDWEDLRSYYIEERAREISAELGLDAETARYNAQLAVHLIVQTVSGQQRARLADDALSVRDQYEYLRQRQALPSIDDLDEDGVRQAVMDAERHQPLTIREFNRLSRALERWQPETAGWNTAEGEMFPALVAHTLGVQLHNPGYHMDHIGPPGRPIHLYYNGFDHWNASQPTHHTAPTTTHAASDSSELSEPPSDSSELSEPASSRNSDDDAYQPATTSPSIGGRVKRTAPAARSSKHSRDDQPSPTEPPSKRPKTGSAVDTSSSVLRAEDANVVSAQRVWFLLDALSTARASSSSVTANEIAERHGGLGTEAVTSADWLRRREWPHRGLTGRLSRMPDYPQYRDRIQQLVRELGIYDGVLPEPVVTFGAKHLLDALNALIEFRGTPSSSKVYSGAGNVMAEKAGIHRGAIERWIKTDGTLKVAPQRLNSLSEFGRYRDDLKNAFEQLGHDETARQLPEPGARIFHNKMTADDLLNALEKLVEDPGKSLGQLARDVGKTPDTLSQYLDTTKGTLRKTQHDLQKLPGYAAQRTSINASLARAQKRIQEMQASLRGSQADELHSRSAQSVLQLLSEFESAKKQSSSVTAVAIARRHGESVDTRGGIADWLRASSWRSGGINAPHRLRRLPDYPQYRERIQAVAQRLNFLSGNLPDPVTPFGASHLLAALRALQDFRSDVKLQAEIGEKERAEYPRYRYPVGALLAKKADVNLTTLESWIRTDGSLTGAPQRLRTLSDYADYRDQLRDAFAELGLSLTASQLPEVDGKTAHRVTGDDVADALAKLADDPTKPLRQVAAELDVSPDTLNTYIAPGTGGLRKAEADMQKLPGYSARRRSIQASLDRLREYGQAMVAEDFLTTMRQGRDQVADAIDRMRRDSTLTPHDAAVAAGAPRQAFALAVNRGPTVRDQHDVEYRLRNVTPELRRGLDRIFEQLTTLARGESIAHTMGMNQVTLTRQAMFGGRRGSGFKAPSRIFIVDHPEFNGRENHSVLKRLYASNPAFMRGPRSYQDDRPRQLLRWISSVLKEHVEKAGEVQAYFDADTETIYVSANTVRANHELRRLLERGGDGLQRLLDRRQLQDREFEGRISRETRHWNKLKSTLSESGADVFDDDLFNRVRSAIHQGRFVVPVEHFWRGPNREVDLHGERRISRALADAGRSRMDLSLLAGTMRACGYCGDALGLNDADPRGPFWQSESARYGLDDEGILTHNTQKSIGTYVTRLRDGKVTANYNTDSASSSDEATGSHGQLVGNQMTADILADVLQKLAQHPGALGQIGRELGLDPGTLGDWIDPESAGLAATTEELLPTLRNYATRRGDIEAALTALGRHEQAESLPLPVITAPEFLRTLRDHRAEVSEAIERMRRDATISARSAAQAANMPWEAFAMAVDRGPTIRDFSSLQSTLSDVEPWLRDGIEDMLDRLNRLADGVKIDDSGMTVVRVRRQLTSRSFIVDNPGSESHGNVNNSSARRLFEQNPDSVRPPRSYESDRPVQLLRWISSVLLATRRSGQEVQAYFDRARQTVYVSSNSLEDNREIMRALRDGSGLRGLADSLSRAGHDARATRHALKLRNALSEGAPTNQDELVDEILTAIRSNRFAIPEDRVLGAGFSEVGLHAERRIKRLVESHERGPLDLGLLAGTKRVCGQCAAALGFEPARRRGPFWLTKNAGFELDSDGIAENNRRQRIGSYVSKTRDGKLTTDYNTDSNSEAPSTSTESDAGTEFDADTEFDPDYESDPDTHSDTSSVTSDFEPSRTRPVPRRAAWSAPQDAADRPSGHGASTQSSLSRSAPAPDNTQVTASHHIAPAAPHPASDSSELSDAMSVDDIADADYTPPVARLSSHTPAVLPVTHRADGKRLTTATTKRARTDEQSTRNGDSVKRPKTSALPTTPSTTAGSSGRTDATADQVVELLTELLTERNKGVLGRSSGQIAKSHGGNSRKWLFASKWNDRATGLDRSVSRMPDYLTHRATIQQLLADLDFYHGRLPEPPAAQRVLGAQDVLAALQYLIRRQQEPESQRGDFGRDVAESTGISRTTVRRHIASRDGAWLKSLDQLRALPDYVEYSDRLADAWERLGHNTFARAMRDSQESLGTEYEDAEPHRVTVEHVASALAALAVDNQTSISELASKRHFADKAFLRVVAPAWGGLRVEPDWLVRQPTYPAYWESIRDSLHTMGQHEQVDSLPPPFTAGDLAHVLSDHGGAFADAMTLMRADVALTPRVAAEAVGLPPVVAAAFAIVVGHGPTVQELSNIEAHLRDLWPRQRHEVATALQDLAERAQGRWPRETTADSVTAADQDSGGRMSLHERPAQGFRRPPQRFIVDRESPEDYVQAPRTYEHDRPRQVLRWLATVIKHRFVDTGGDHTFGDVQAYFDEHADVIYLSSNTVGVNKQIDALHRNGGLDRLLADGPNSDLSSRQARHWHNLERKLSEASDGQDAIVDRIVAAIRNQNFRVPLAEYRRPNPTGGRPLFVHLHAERRILRALPRGSLINLDLLAGTMRACGFCAADLGFEKERRRGPFWMSQNASYDLTPEEIIQGDLENSIGTYSTRLRNGEITVDYNTDSADSDAGFESDLDEPDLDRAGSAESSSELSEIGSSSEWSQMGAVGRSSASQAPVALCVAVASSRTVSGQNGSRVAAAGTDENDAPE